MTTEFHKQVMSAFAERLKSARVDAGYAHAKDFADALGVEAPTYRYWERGQAHPDLTTLTRICLLLGVDANYLLPIGSKGRGKAHDEPGKAVA